MGYYTHYIKRGFDIIVAVFGLVLVSPVFVAVLLVQLAACRGRPFFYQRRAGKDGRSFRVIKFRTMNGRRDAQGQLLPDAGRLTAMGRWLRKTSLDELPQLINVIRGEMSIIGPRPLLEKYLPLYDQRQARRHAVRPGITGWAQVNGRNELDWEQKFEYDVWYVDHVSMATDLKILAMTVKKVFHMEGISSQGHVTMPEFKGSKKL